MRWACSLRFRSFSACDSDLDLAVRCAYNIIYYYTLMIVSISIIAITILTHRERERDRFGERGAELIHGIIWKKRCNDDDSKQNIRHIIFLTLVMCAALKRVPRSLSRHHLII